MTPHSTQEARTNAVVAGNRRPVEFVGPTIRMDIFLKVRASQVAMYAALEDKHDYTQMPTEDLVELGKLHLQAVGFKGLAVNSRATALAALLGISIKGGRK